MHATIVPGTLSAELYKAARFVVSCSATASTPQCHRGAPLPCQCLLNQIVYVIRTKFYENGWNNILHTKTKADLEVISY